MQPVAVLLFKRFNCWLTYANNLVKSYSQSVFFYELKQYFRSDVRVTEWTRVISKM